MSTLALGNVGLTIPGWRQVAWRHPEWWAMLVSGGSWLGLLTLSLAAVFIPVLFMAGILGRLFKEFAVTITVVEVNDCPIARINNGIVVWAPPGGLVSASENFILSANGSNATVIVDGSLSSDVECDPLTYAWYLNGSVVPFATSVIATNVLPIGEHQFQLVVDDGTCVGQATLAIEVISPSDAVGLVIDEIYNSNLERREQRPLIASLKVAIASFDRDGAVSGINQLNAFLNKVKAQISKDYPTESALWTAQIESIIAAVRASGVLDGIPGQANR